MSAFECDKERLSIGREHVMQGFRITFDNGYTVSTVFGSGNYSDMGETTAEVAVWDNHNATQSFVYVPGLTSQHDQVAARITPEVLAHYLQIIATAQPGTFKLAIVGDNEPDPLLDI